jgi:hypothetical protein
MQERPILLSNEQVSILISMYPVSVLMFTVPTFSKDPYMHDIVLAGSYVVPLEKQERNQVCFNHCAGDELPNRIKSSTRFRSLRCLGHMYCTLRAYPSFRGVWRITAGCRFVVGLDFTSSKITLEVRVMHVCKSISGKSGRKS